MAELSIDSPSVNDVHSQLKMEKVGDYIHADIALSILLKLPIKSFKRFNCVCKSWSLLFENPNFMSMYRNKLITSNRSSYEDAFILLAHQNLRGMRHMLYFLSGERYENKVKLDWPPPFQEDDVSIFMIGPVINGIVCLYQGLTPKVVLWNPTIEEFKVIPPSLTESVVIYEVEYFDYYGFGYDIVRDDYNVIRYARYLLDVSDTEDMKGKPNKLSRNNTWEIYSLRSNSWKKLDLDLPHCHSNVSDVFIYMNGACHWGKNNGNESYMVSFDLSNEVLCITPFPTDMNDSFDDFVRVNKHLMLLNESIALILNYQEMTTFHISILGELGVKESWTKLFIIGPIPCIEHPVGEGKNGDLFFRRKDDEIVWFNYYTQMIEELGHKGDAYTCQTIIYKESLLPIGQIYD